MEQSQEYHQTQTLSWAAGATRDERMQLLKRIFDILPEDELAQISNLASKAKKRRKRKAPKQVVPAPEKSVSVPPASPVHSLEEQIGWYRKFKSSDFFALDVEKVNVKIENPTTRKKFLQKAAKVTVVDINEDIAMEAIIWHKNDTYVVTPHTFKVNGIRQNSLQNPKNVKPIDVTNKLHELLDGKLIIGLKLLDDLESLDLAFGDFNTFDLNWHWWRSSLNQDRVYVKEDLGLRSLSKHYFNFDMQMDGMPHSDYVDAVWTMRLFRDIYMKIQPEPTLKYNDIPSNKVEHFKNLYKKSSW